MSNSVMKRAPCEHELKIHAAPLNDLLSGAKTGEIRDCYDRDFAVGDTVLLREVAEDRTYTGRTARRTITHVQKHYGLPDHMCVLSYGQPAEQHQGEPVGWQFYQGGKWWNGDDRIKDHRKNTEDAGYPVRPVFTHADPGEVERLRTIVEQQKNLIASLRAELVESRSIDAIAEPSAAAESIPEGYCIMPRRLTAENGAKALLLGEFKLEVTPECPECLELDEPAEGCEICDGGGEYAQRHTIPWDQIKFIYSEAVKGLALQSNATRKPS